MQLVAGAKVAGKYELERRIGVGGMGEVWSAVQSPTRKRVALKFLKAAKEEDASESESTRKRFLREARAACAVQHPNVVEIHDVLALEDGAPVMVMEFLSGETLEARLARDGKMALGEIAAVLVRVVSAVGAAHALGIVHRDLKPDNVFLSETADGVDIKVLDFGIAKLTALEGDAAQTGGLTNTGAMLGTPYYMSPEQAFGERNIDHRADVWSLGIILYRALTGVLPTRADNIGQILKIIMMGEIRPIETIAPDLPADLAELVGRMLAPKREDRPESLLEVKQVLERYAGVEVASFGAPVVSAPPDARASQISIDARDASARTRDEVAAAVDGNASVAGVAKGAEAPSTKKLPFALIGGGVVAVAAAVGVALFARPTTSPTEAASAPASPVEPVPSTRPATSASTSAPAAAPPASSGPPAASASAAASTGPAAPLATSPVSRPGRAAASAPPKETGSPAATPAKPQGGILEAPPVF